MSGAKVFFNNDLVEITSLEMLYWIYTADSCHPAVCKKAPTTASQNTMVGLISITGTIRTTLTAAL